MPIANARRRYVLPLAYALLCALVLGCAPVSSVNAQSAAPLPAVNLAQDARLERTVDVAEVGVSLDELLQKLSAKGLTLRAGTSCREQKVQVRLKQRPLRLLMEALAQMLPGVWEPLENKRGYELHLTDGAFARRDNWWRLFLSERDKAFAAQKAYVLERLRGERKVAEVRENINEEHETDAVAEHNFFRSLPASLQERIASQLNTNPFYGLFSIGFSTFDDESETVASLAELPASVQDIVRQQVANRMEKEVSAITWNGATLSFSNGGVAVLASVSLPKGVHINDAFTTGFHPAGPELPAITLDHSQLTDIVRQLSRLGKDAPDGWKRLAAYHESRVWKNDLPQQPLRSQHKRKRSELLSWLDKQAGIEFVSDYYSFYGGSPMSEPERAAPLKRPLKEELDAIAQEQNISWKRNADGIHLFRDNRWYRDDYLEVPAPLLRRWMGANAFTFAKAEGKDVARAFGNADSKKTKEIVETSAQQLKRWMDREAEFAAVLTPWQIANGLRYFMPEDNTLTPQLRKALEGSILKTASGTPLNIGGNGCPFWQETVFLMHQYNTIRFYARLDDAAKTAVLANALAWSSLTPGQQALALAALPSLRTLLGQKLDAPLLLGMQPNARNDSPDAGPLAGKLFVAQGLPLAADSK